MKKIHCPRCGKKFTHDKYIGFAVIEMKKHREAKHGKGVSNDARMA